MSKYELNELARLWRLQRLTIEQMVGQLTLHAQDLARQVPDQTEAIDKLKDHFSIVEGRVTRLKERKNLS